MIDFRNVTIEQLHKMYVNKEVSVEEVITSIIKRAKQNEFNAFNEVCEDLALKQAREIDERGVKNLFDGIPCVIKDNINYVGSHTTCSSKILQGYKSVYNATVVEKLLENNCIIIGKANMDEFAMGASNTTSYTGNVLHPIDKNRIPGGSSGGSAAVVASGLVPFSLGSDTGGSVRQPASYCGLVGFRPTYGMISRYGVVSLNCSLDQVGPLTNTVEENMQVFAMLQGLDVNDTTTLNTKFAIESVNDVAVEKSRIAIVTSSFENVNDEVKVEMKKVQQFLEDQGFNLEIVDLKYLKYASYAYTGLVGCEITSNLSMFDGIRYGYRSENYNELDELYANTRGEGFGKEVKRRILIGADLLKLKNHEKYDEILKLRNLIYTEFNQLFEKFDYILTPSAPSVAYTFEEFESLTKKSELYESQFMDATALAGVTGISVPMGVGEESKLPLGLHIVGKRLNESGVFAFAKYFENTYKVGEM